MCLACVMLIMGIDLAQCYGSFICLTFDLNQATQLNYENGKASITYNSFNI